MSEGLTLWDHRIGQPNGPALATNSSFSNLPVTNHLLSRGLGSLLPNSHSVMHTHLHVGDNPVDPRVWEYVNTLRGVTLFLIHDPHGHGLYPPYECFITSGLALWANEETRRGLIWNAGNTLWQVRARQPLCYSLSLL